MRKGSIRGILIGIYLLAIAIAMVLGLRIYQAVTQKDRLARKYVEELEYTQTCEDLLKLMIKQIDEQSLELTLNPEISLAYEAHQIEDNLEVGKILNNWILHNTSVKSVHMLGMDGQLFSASNISTDRYRKESFIRQFSTETLAQIHEKQGQILIGIGSDFIGSNDEKSLYVARRMNETSQLEAVGYLICFLDIEVVKEQLESYLRRNHLELLIVDRCNHVLNFGESNELEKLHSLWMRDKLDDQEKKMWESEYHHAELNSSTLGLTLLGQYTMEPVDSDLSNIVIALSLINLIFLLIGIIAVRSIVIKPLEKITQIARQISKEGTLNTRFEVGSIYKESYIIGDALNDMMNKINLLIKEAEEREQQKRMLELSVINHQVNPHFLFNTLNSVTMLIAVEDKKTALKLVKGLAKYYRACLSQENNLNTIEQELAIMGEYVHIIELKNPNLIHLDVQVTQEAYNKKIPRMILQTLVENSVKYGIKTIEEPLEIKMSITIDKVSEITIIEIYDNGKGMEDEIRNNILSGISLKNKSGFGIKSTIKRIKLMYQIEKVEDIIEIDSKLGEYTKIKLRIPEKAVAKKYNKDAY